MIWRGYMEFTYSTCQRCWAKQPISLMEWDNGQLVCIDRCKDNSVDGAFENAMAKAASEDRHELVPDPKLVHPVDPGTQIDTLPASSGVY